MGPDGGARAKATEWTARRCSPRCGCSWNGARTRRWRRRRSTGGLAAARAAPAAPPPPAAGRGARPSRPAAALAAPGPGRPPAAPRAAELAAAAADLEALRDAIAAFDGSPLRETATNLVFADGAEGAA